MFALKPFFLKSRSVTAQGWFWGPAGRITGKEEWGWGTHFCVVFVSVVVFVNLQHINNTLIMIVLHSECVFGPVSDLQLQLI